MAFLIRLSFLFFAMTSPVRAQARLHQPQLMSQPTGSSEPAKYQLFAFVTDLTLVAAATAAGVEALYGRIHAAARRVCEQPAGELAAVRGA
jgi:hypothetical protein